MRDRHVAFLGLGVMGLPIARTLIGADFRLRVWNRSIEKAAPLAGLATICGDASEAASEAEIVALCLTDANAVEQVLFGNDGVMERLRPGAIIVDFSTIGMRVSRDVGERLAARDVGYVDAPVSGGPGAAAQGLLTIFCGGSDLIIARARPVFEAISAHWTHMGGIGAGQATKLCNQLIVSSTLVAIAEAVAVAHALDLHVDRLPDALRGGYADSKPLQIFGPRMVSQQLEPKLGAIAIMHKDVRAIFDDVRELPIKLDFFEGTKAFYDNAMSAGLGDVDLGALVRLARPD
jgi:3-hydroxyisobutyrate dehydrogenase/2-hydroxy-3-oxopropionate reductase